MLRREVPLLAMDPSEDESRSKGSQERSNPMTKQLEITDKIVMTSQDEQQMDFNFSKQLQQIFLVVDSYFFFCVTEALRNSAESCSSGTLEPSPSVLPTTNKISKLDFIF